MVKLISIFIFSFLPFAVVSQTIDLNGGADKAFKELFETREISESQCVRESNNPTSTEAIEHFKCRELAKLKFREDGLKLWDTFKDDSRRYDWFFQTTQDAWTNLYYWINIDSGVNRYFAKTNEYSSYASPLDWKKLNAWNQRYPKMKKEYFAYLAASQIKGKESYIFLVKTWILLKELEDFLKLSLNEEYRHYEKTDLNILRERFRNLARVITAYNKKNSSILSNDEKRDLALGIKRAMDNDFLACYNQLGLTTKDIIGFINSLKNDSDPIVSQWCIQRESLFALRQHPLQLKDTAIDGRRVDLEQLRGKVVLVDIWATTCSSCIARMPAIKQVYDKFKSQGFEVISVCCNGRDKLKTIEQIEKKVNSDWPIVLAGHFSANNDNGEISLASQLFEKYGFFGVPQLLLLDKKGKLVLLNDILRFGDFEPLLIKLLNEN